MKKNVELLTIGELNSSHIGKTVTLKGLIVKIRPDLLRLIEGAFRCANCGHITNVRQPEYTAYRQKTPLECENKILQKDSFIPLKCGRKKFELIAEKSEFIDLVELVLKDRDDKKLRGLFVYVEGRELISKIPVLFVGSILGKVTPITVTGVIGAGARPKKSTDGILYLIVKEII